MSLPDRQTGLNLVNFVPIIAIGIGSALFHGAGLFQNPPWHIVYSDIVPFFEKARESGFPYIGKTIEYPVLTGLFVHLMGVIGVGMEIGYYIATSIFLIAFAAGATYLLVRMREKMNNQKPLYLFWILAPSMLVFMIYNWDIIAVFFTVLGLYMMQKDRPYAAAAAFAFGFASKFYPIIYLVPLVLAHYQKSQKRIEFLKHVVGISAVFLATALALNGIFMIANWEYWSYFFTFNRLREANPDSIWTVIQFLFGSLEVATINIVSLFLFATSYALFLWRYRKTNPIFLAFGGTILFLLFNKVFSPQYLLWLLPFFVLLPIKKRWFYALEIFNLAALFSILAWFFLGREAIYLWLTLAFVVVRHAALMSVLASLLWARRHI